MTFCKDHLFWKYIKMAEHLFVIQMLLSIISQIEQWTFIKERYKQKNFLHKDTDLRTELMKNEVHLKNKSY